MSLVSFKRHGNIGVVRLERPEALNAISGALADELTATLQRLRDDEEIWVVVLAAAGEKAFCVGADLKERAGFTLEDFHRNRTKIMSMFAELRAVAQPTIASVFGFALGGGFELALSCDLIVAAEGTHLGLPEARVGLLPAGGGTQLLTRKVGVARAKDLIFRGRRIDTSEAHAMGLVSAVVPQSELEEAALGLADEVCRCSPIAVREAKRAIDAALGAPLKTGFEIEQNAWEAVIASRDRAEGIAAFAEKREPKWENR